MRLVNNNGGIWQYKTKRWILSIVFSGLLLLCLLATLDVTAPGATIESPNIQSHSQDPQPLTIHCNYGRLGNQMCTLASLYGLSVLNNRKMLIPPCNYQRLKDSFDISIPVLDERHFQEKFPWIIKPYLENKDMMINPESNIIKGYTYPCSYTFFNHVRKEIKNLFKFKPEIQRYAQNVLSKARGQRTEDVVFVGVHVRRTDYLGTEPGHWLHAFQGKSVDLEYFERATNYYKKKYPNVLFVAVSDDRDWCRKNLVQFGIHVTEDAPSPAHDIATIANCNHTIMTYGTFGFWGSYLAGGEVVYFDKFLKPNTEFTTNEFLFEKMYLPEWVGIETNSTNQE